MNLIVAPVTIVSLVITVSYWLRANMGTGNVHYLLSRVNFPSRPFVRARRAGADEIAKIRLAVPGRPAGRQRAGEQQLSRV